MSVLRNLKNRAAKANKPQLLTEWDSELRFVPAQLCSHVGATKNPFLYQGLCIQSPRPSDTPASPSHPTSDTFRRLYFGFELTQHKVNLGVLRFHSMTTMKGQRKFHWSIMSPLRSCGLLSWFTQSTQGWVEVRRARHMSLTVHVENLPDRFITFSNCRTQVRGGKQRSKTLWGGF